MILSGTPSRYRFDPRPRRPLDAVPLRSALVALVLGALLLAGDVRFLDPTAVSAKVEPRKDDPVHDVVQAERSVLRRRKDPAFGRIAFSLTVKLQPVGEDRNDRNGRSRGLRLRRSDLTFLYDCSTWRLPSR